MKTTKEKIAVMQAFEDGKTIQVRRLNDHQWQSLAISDSPTWDWYNCDYRIAQEPKLRPWKPEEVPVGALIRLQDDRSNTLPSIIASANNDSLSYVAAITIETLKFRDALQNYLFSYDLGKTWHPCGIKE